MSGSAQRGTAPRRANNIPTEPIALCWWWWDRRYEKNRTSSVSMRDRTELLLNKHIVPWLRRLNLESIDQLNRVDVEDFMLELAGMNKSRPTSVAALSAAEYYTTEEAARLCGCHISKLKHLRANGRLPNATLADVPGANRKRLLIPAGDLLALGFDLSGARPARDQRDVIAMQRKTANELLLVIRRVCRSAVASGLATTDATVDVQAAEPIKALARPKRRPEDERVFTLAEARQLAAELNVHHQLAMWMQRLDGPRAAEVFGALNEHFFRHNDRLLWNIRLQGGKPVRVRDDDGQITSVRSRPPKTKNGIRTIVVPRKLEEFIEAYLDAFHRDEDGNVDPKRPLICGFRDVNCPSVNSYLQALQSASRRIGIVITKDGIPGTPVIPGISSHTLRRSLAGEIHHHRLADESLRSEQLGHSPGTGMGGSPITMRHYTPAPSDLERFIALADGIDQLVESQIGDIFVPTLHQATLATTNPLRERLSRAESVFSSHGYARLGEVTIDGELWVDVSTASEYIDRTESHVRTMIRSGVLRATRHQLTPQRQILVIPVAALKDLGKSIATYSSGDLAAMFGISQYSIWHQAKSGALPAVFDDALGRYTFTEEAVEQVRQQALRRQEIRQRAISLHDASRRLGISERAARVLIQLGRLERDEAPTANNWIYVTLNSVERCRAELVNLGGRRPGGKVDLTDRVSIEDAATQTGLTASQLRVLATAGVLVRVDHSHRTHFTRESLDALQASGPPTFTPMLA